MLDTDLQQRNRSRACESSLLCAGERPASADEQGFMLLALVVAIFLILLALGVAAPRVAHELQREREVETVRRGNAYVRAIEVYYLKMGHYPSSIDQLEKTNNIRFLRKQYIDPLTGKSDWRLIHLGEAKTTVKGFFGQPLGGIESSGLGSAAGSISPGGGGNSPQGSGLSFGSSSSTSGAGGLSGLSSGTTGGATSSLGGGIGGSNSSGGIGSTNSSGTSGSQSGTGITGTGGPIVGVGLEKEGNSIMTLNEQTTYPTWEFLYDPRIEQLKAKVNLFGGGMTSTSATDIGSSGPGGSNSGPGSSNSGTGTGTGSQPSNGTSGNSTFGSGSFGGGGFGSGGFGSGSGSSPTSNSPQ